MKTCTKCRVEKSIDEFCKDRSTKDGLNCHCKDCIRQYQRAYSKTFRGHLYQCFKDMNKRCNKPRRRKYKYWGGRGIRCLFKSFGEFVHYVTHDLGLSTVKDIAGLQIHRPDNDGHYEPGNIEFLTLAEHRARH